MNVVSVCSGGGGGDLGLVRAGLTIAAACEIEPHARAVLRRNHPDTRIYHNITEVTRDQLTADGIGHVDLVVGGTPCQDLSVAGGRAGLAGVKSSLFGEFVRVIDDVAPTWVLWENVDGALSCTGGEDFAVILEGLTGHRPDVPRNGWSSGGWCQGPARTCAWRVLDARGFGVPHRRRRVFALAGAGAVAPRAVEVLFEPEASGRDSASRRKEGPDAPAEVGRGVAAFGSGGGGLSDVPALTTKDRNDADTEAFVVSALDTGGGGVGRQRRSGWAPRCAAPLLAKNGGSRTTDIDGGTYIVIDPVSIAENQRGEVVESDYTHALSTGGGQAWRRVRGGGAADE